jgi:DNA-binding NarL/FixJ family response regulator
MTTIGFTFARCHHWRRVHRTCRSNVTRDFELTPSGRRVAELAASGHTNRDVASKLFVGTKTVEASLTQVYRKLGVHSRAELGRVMSQ